MIPAMLEEKGKLQEYSTILSDLEKRYDSAVKTIDDFQGAGRFPGCRSTHRKEAKIALKRTSSYCGRMWLA